MADRYTAGEPTLIADMRRIVLTPAHRALLREHSGVALTVRANTPVVTVAVCTGCGEWEAVATGKPSKCSLTLNCGGELVSAGSVPYRFAMRPKG